MIFTRERKHVINMGNYESLTIGATVEIESDQFASLEEAVTKADELLDQILAAEVQEAIDLTHTKDSYILSYRKS